MNFIKGFIITMKMNKRARYSLILVLFGIFAYVLAARFLYPVESLYLEAEGVRYAGPLDGGEPQMVTVVLEGKLRNTEHDFIFERGAALREARLTYRYYFDGKLTFGEESYTVKGKVRKHPAFQNGEQVFEVYLRGAKMGILYISEDFERVKVLLYGGADSYMPIVGKYCIVAPASSVEEAEGWQPELKNSVKLKDIPIEVYLNK